MSGPLRLVVPLAVAALLACASAAPPQGTLPVLTPADTDPAAGYERTPKLRASEFLPAELARGPHHRVREEVRSDGFLRLYSIESDFGEFEAAGDVALRVAVQEIRALAALRELLATPDFAAARDAGLERPFVASWKLITRPVAALEGMAQEAWADVMRIARLRPAERSEAERRERREVIAFEASKRRVARRLGVNPYTLNPKLQTELNRVAWASSAGGLAIERIPSLVETSVAPQPEDVISAERLADLYQHDSPEDLRRRNHIELAVMGLPEPSIDAFLSNPWYSPRQQTGVVESLVVLEPARNRAAYVQVALRASSPADPLFYLIGSLILRAHHLRVARIEEIVEIGPRMAGAYTEQRKLVVAAPVDYLLWTRPTEAFVRRFADAKTEGLEVEARELWLSGTLSPKARREIEALGIRVVEGAFERTFERLAPSRDDGPPTGPEPRS